MTLTPAQLTDSWHRFGCDYCDQGTDHRCRTTSGALTTPHLNRRTKMDAWLSRQPEVDALQQAVDLRDATISADEDALRRITVERDGLKVDLQAATLEVTGLTEQVATLTKSLVVTIAERDRLQAKLDGLNPPPPPPPVVPPGGGTGVVHAFNLAKNDGWTLETGKPSNADGSDRPANAVFGQGPEGTSLLILGNRDKAGGTFYTADAKAMHVPVANYHRGRAVIEYDPIVAGMWPAIWLRPLGGEGEIDVFETFGGHLGKANETAGTLHTSPYDATHKQVSRNFPKFGPGRHTLEWELKPGAFTWWVDGQQTGQVTKAQFDAATSNRWDAMFGTATKKWYLRATLQAGGNEGGAIPASLTAWRFWVHELSVLEPAA